MDSYPSTLARSEILSPMDVARVRDAEPEAEARLSYQDRERIPSLLLRPMV